MLRRNFMKHGAGAGGLALIARTANGQQENRPEKVTGRKQPMSTGGLSKERLDRMHNVMAGYVERGRMPGLVTLVSRRGELHVDVIGNKAFGTSGPMRRDTI